MSKQQSAQKQASDSHLVVKSFRDVKDWDVLYSEGDNVNHLTPDRLAVLVEKGLVKKQ